MNPHVFLNVSSHPASNHSEQKISKANLLGTLQAAGRRFSNGFPTRPPWRRPAPLLIGIRGPGAIARIAGAVALLCLLASVIASGESPHVFGVHFWDWGVDLDVMNWQSGWVTEANDSEYCPNISGRYAPAVAEGFTILQRLDWSFDCSEGTIPRDPADYERFADQCAYNWAMPLRTWCRHYVIGNEMEICGPIGAEEYAACFTLVRDEIRAIQPEALVIIGAFTSVQNLRTVLRILGLDGYDGVAVHFNGVPSGAIEVMDEEGAHPSTGVYITEFGWVIGGNPQATAEMLRIYNDLAAWNADPDHRPVFASCWYFYPEWLPTAEVFSLELGTAENQAFGICTSLGTCRNAYDRDPVTMSRVRLEIPTDPGTAPVFRWQTDLAARPTVWYQRSGWDNGEFAEDLDANGYRHAIAIDDSERWVPGHEYLVVCRSHRWGNGDADSGPLRAASSTWSVTVDDLGGTRARVRWETGFPAVGSVEYGPSRRYGSEAAETVATMSHDLILTGLAPETIVHFQCSAHADGYIPHITTDAVFTSGVAGPRTGFYELSALR